jgi:hypothetical protein
VVNKTNKLLIKMLMIIIIIIIQFESLMLMKFNEKRTELKKECYLVGGEKGKNRTW